MLFRSPFPHPLSAALGAPQFTLQDAVYNDFKTPYLYQYNLTIQHQLPGKVIGTAAYVGSTGRHIVARYDGNTPIPTVRADGTLFNPTTAIRRQPQFAELQTRRLSGLSYYNSLQLSFIRRSSNGLQLQGSYTHSKSIDMSGGLFSEEATNAAVGVAIPDNLFNERALSNFDIRDSAVFNLMYELPVGKNLHGAAKQVVQGWSLGAITTFAGGVTSLWRIRRIVLRTSSRARALQTARP